MGMRDIPIKASHFYLALGLPAVNEQSKNKIDLKADKIQLGQCVVISDDSFDMEVLEDGHIYFLNTQKLSKSSNLTKHSDGRQYTIWETIANTVYEKPTGFTSLLMRHIEVHKNRAI